MKYTVYACVLMLLNAVVSCIKIDDPQPCLPVQGTIGYTVHDNLLVTVSLELTDTLNLVDSVAWSADSGHPRPATNSKALVQFSKPGQYRVTAVVKKDCGGQDTLVRNIDVPHYRRQLELLQPPAGSKRLRLVAVDSANNKWTSTEFGLYKFDGSRWTQYLWAKDTIPATLTSSLTVDHAGNIWIGSIEGLIRFNGHTFKRYLTSNSPLPHNQVESVEEDAAGNIWIGTYGGGIAKLSPKGAWAIYNEAGTSHAIDRVYRLYIDQPGNLWVGTGGQGVHRYSSQGDWRSFNTGSSSSLDHVVDIRQETGGKYWVGTLGGFLGFNGDTHWEQDTSKTGVFAIAIDHRNTKWFVRSQDVYESIYKVSRYEEETGITDFSYRNSIMPRSYILGIAVDHDDAVWLPTGEGLIKITRVRE